MTNYLMYAAFVIVGGFLAWASLKIKSDNTAFTCSTLASGLLAFGGVMFIFNSVMDLTGTSMS